MESHGTSEYSESGCMLLPRSRKDPPHWLSHIMAFVTPHLGRATLTHHVVVAQVETDVFSVPGDRTPNTPHKMEPAPI